jgi:hypothetical protein
LIVHFSVGKLNLPIKEQIQIGELALHFLSTMAKNRNRGIWDQATPLDEAWLKFASAQGQEELSKLPSGHEEMQNQLLKASGLLNLIYAASVGLNANTKLAAIISRLKEELLDNLFNSNLLAFGYRQAPSQSRGPVQIDPTFFEYPEIDWEGNSAEFDGKKYRIIRIINSNDLKDEHKLRTGRPTSGPVINSAIIQLIKSHPEFCNLPRSIACHWIRDVIAHPSVSGNGLSNKNLEKYIILNCGRRKIPI